MLLEIHVYMMTIPMSFSDLLACKNKTEEPSTLNDAGKVFVPLFLYFIYEPASFSYQ